MSSTPWSDADRKRRFHRNEVGDQRTEFERDRDRLLYSSAFQRLAGITQIVRAGEAGVFHTRQQHTIKVAQVGRRLAQKLLHEQKTEAEFRGLDPEVVEAACLAHDLGHPPFGHVGEFVLNSLVGATEDDGFEGNAQSFRIVCKLAVRFQEFDGVDLTCATLAACLKYPWFRERTGKKSEKWSAYRSEEREFEHARRLHRHESKTLEAELMDWADDVAYSVHDIEDFHRCNSLPWQKALSEKSAIIEHALAGSADTKRRGELEAAYDRVVTRMEKFHDLLSEPYDGSRPHREQLRRMTSEMIGRYIGAIHINPNLAEEAAVGFDRTLVDEVRVLKQITRDYVIANPTLAAQQHGQKRIIEELYGSLYNAIDKKTGIPPFLPVRLRYLREIKGTTPARFVSDCIASLSEAEAIALHARLTGAVTGSILDPIVR